MSYQPPFTITPKIIQLISMISECVGGIDATVLNQSPQLRKQNRIKTITSTLAIEGNTLGIEQVTAIVDGKQVMGSQREIAEVHGAIVAYELLPTWQYSNEQDLLKAHLLLMGELMRDAGKYRAKAVGIHKGDKVVHVAPQANRVPLLMSDLLRWSKQSEHHALIVSCVFHYEFEYIHPFTDGNGRMGRLWQTLILGQWKELFYLLPLESVIKDKQAEYYSALSQSDSDANSTVFIEFMLESIYAVLIQNQQQSDQGDVQVSDQVNKLLSVINSDWLSAAEIMHQLSLSHRATFRKNYLNPALELGLIKMSNPDSPRSPKQKYKRI